MFMLMLMFSVATVGMEIMSIIVYEGAVFSVIPWVTNCCIAVSSFC